jgi:adenylyltransferase/sulfurtransferase
LLLDLPGRLGDEVLTVDLLGLGTARLRARRRSDCAGRCTLAASALQKATQQLQTEMADGSPELQFDDLQLAVDAGYALIDIRDAKEIAATPLPLPALAIPMNELLEGRNLPVEGRYLLVCARGARSLGTTRALRERGLGAVFSLQGGALGLLARRAGN